MATPADAPHTLPPPWWTAHVAGLIVCHAAFWFGYWQLAGNRSFPDALYEATVVPLFGMLVLAIFSVPVVALIWGLILGAAHRPWRWTLTFAAYVVAAGYWGFIAHGSADVDF